MYAKYLSYIMRIMYDIKAERSDRRERLLHLNWANRRRWSRPSFEKRSRRPEIW